MHCYLVHVLIHVYTAQGVLVNGQYKPVIKEIKQNINTINVKTSIIQVLPGSLV